MELLLKIESRASVNRARALLREIMESIVRQPRYKNLAILCNVDV